MDGMTDGKKGGKEDRKWVKEQCDLREKSIISYGQLIV